MWAVNLICRKYMYQIFQSSLASHLSDGGSLGASKVHHEQHSCPHLLRHIHHPTTLLHRHLREGDVVCVCVFMVYLVASIS